uniref:Secreted protein n=1 Tax=Lutzomyia longipalpis TaxID=7200 RepID=A0A7G3B7F4_LUTLO
MYSLRCLLFLFSFFISIQPLLEPQNVLFFHQKFPFFIIFNLYFICYASVCLASEIYKRFILSIFEFFLK